MLTSAINRINSDTIIFILNFSDTYKQCALTQVITYKYKSLIFILIDNIFMNIDSTIHQNYNVVNQTTQTSIVKPSQTQTHHTTLGFIYNHYKEFIQWNYDNTFSNFIVVKSNASSMDNET